MTVSSAEIKGVKIISPEGEFDYDPKDHLQKMMNDFSSNGKTDTIVNLQGVTEISILLLHNLARLYNLCRRQGKRMALASVPKYAGTIIESTGLIRLFPQAPTVDEALAMINE